MPRGDVEQQRDAAGRFRKGHAVRPPTPTLLGPDVEVTPELAPLVERHERVLRHLHRNVLGRRGVALRPLARSYALACLWSEHAAQRAAQEPDGDLRRALVRESGAHAREARAALAMLVRLATHDLAGRPKGKGKGNGGAGDELAALLTDDDTED